MPLLGGFRIGRWLGFPIRIDYSWFLVAALVVWTFSRSEFPRQLPGYGDGTYLWMGVGAALLFFLSVLLHELGHAVVARTRGITVEGITLFVFGGIAHARDEAKKPLDEFLLTAAGPLTSLALAGVFYLLRAGAVAAGASPPIVTVLGFLGLLNLVLAIFNMIPGFPLDGGRILRSIVWAATGDLRRATRLAAWGGRLFGGGLILLGVLSLAYGQLLGGLWSGFIGWFLLNAATTSERHSNLRVILSSITVEQAMTPNPPRIAARTSVRDAIAAYFLLHGFECFPVELDGVLVGMADLGRVAEVPRERRAETTVADVMVPVYQVAAVGPALSLADALSRIDERTPGAFVVDGTRLIGVLEVTRAVGWAQRMSHLGLLDGTARLADGRDAGPEDEPSEVAGRMAAVGEDA